MDARVEIEGSETEVFHRGDVLLLKDNDLQHSSAAECEVISSCRNIAVNDSLGTFTAEIVFKSHTHMIFVHLFTDAGQAKAVGAVGSPAHALAAMETLSHNGIFHGEG